MDFVLEGINAVYDGGSVCDLFAGSASLSGAIGKQVPIHSNDIQNYSAVLSDAYLRAWKDKKFPASDDILEKAEGVVKKNRKNLSFEVNYFEIKGLRDFNQAEKLQQTLINRSFRRDWHLFAKYYSGTWWSVDQCLWIDAIRQIAELYKGTPSYSVILSSLMFAMAYTSQGTGHYAQYRDAKTISSMEDILIYRKRSLAPYFKKRFDDVRGKLPRYPTSLKHKITSLDFYDCLKQTKGGTVYADPPYCFVHYSRFYHAIETLVLYDYPSIQNINNKVVKGRYREVRHQSPFCIKTLVKEAFERLFDGINRSGANLVLSYSNTGMITVDEISELANLYFQGKSMDVLFIDHKHMTLGRQKDRHREVEECLILVK
jgi:adenine-specific DNA-methyltransferase